MKVGVYPGSFDPITLGHLDIITRSSKVVDKLIIAVLNNGGKNPKFTTLERMEMLKESTKDLNNVEVEYFSGLLVDFMEVKKANFIIRGLRSASDFEFELQLAQTNNKLNDKIETIFLTTKVQYSYISSSLVKEVLSFDGDIKDFVPKAVVKYIEEQRKVSSNGNDR